MQKTLNLASYFACEKYVGMWIIDITTVQLGDMLFVRLYEGYLYPNKHIQYVCDQYTIVYSSLLFYIKD